jgi:hypothetical protein
MYHQRSPDREQHRPSKQHCHYAITALSMKSRAGSSPGRWALGLRSYSGSEWFSDIRYKARRNLGGSQLEATVTPYTLDQLRQRYVIEGRPLEASLEEILRADTRAGARAILAAIEKRRFEKRAATSQDAAL